MIKRVGKSAEEHAQELQVRLLKGLEKGVKAIESDAKVRVGVDTGNLRRSITSDVVMRGNSIVGKVGSNVEYAFFHSLMNPYLTGAVDSNLEFVKNCLKES